MYKRQVVTSLGYEVTTSGSVAQALKWVHANAGADLYLVDILLPGGQSGVEFAALLRQIRPDANVIFMSGFAADLLPPYTGLNPETAFISKPFEIAPLSIEIAAALSAKT